MDSLQVAIRALDGEHERLLQEQEHLAGVAAKLTGDELLRAHVASNARAARIADVQRQRLALRDDRTASREELARAQNEIVPLPDNWSDEDYTKLLAEALGEPRDTTAEYDGPLADDLSVANLAEIFGTTEQTINRWYRSGPPRGQTLPWDTTGWLIEGERSKKLSVEALDMSLLSAAQADRLLIIRQRDGSTDADANGPSNGEACA